MIGQLGRENSKEDEMTDDTIGFIGLGDMGEPMAARLLQHGFRVVSCANRRREPIELLIGEGLHEAANPHAVGAQADILMTIVIDEVQTNQVLRGPEGALESMKPGSAVILMSTLSPKYCQDLAREAAAEHIMVIDCPVSGMRAGAEAGTLSLMTGGDAATIERCRKPLEAMGNIVHCGEIGMGQVVKLGNNATSLATLAILREVRELVQAQGMDLEQFMAILNQSTGRSFNSENLGLYAPPIWGHLINIARKDVALCLDVAGQCGVDMPMLKQHQAFDWEATKETFF